MCTISELISPGTWGVGASQWGVHSVNRVMVTCQQRSRCPAYTTMCGWKLIPLTAGTLQRCWVMSYTATLSSCTTWWWCQEQPLNSDSGEGAREFRQMSPFTNRWGRMTVCFTFTTAMSRWKRRYSLFCSGCNRKNKHQNLNFDIVPLSDLACDGRAKREPLPTQLRTSLSEETLLLALLNSPVGEHSNGNALLSTLGCFFFPRQRKKDVYLWALRPIIFHRL